MNRTPNPRRRIRKGPAKRTRTARSGGRGKGSSGGMLVAAAGWLASAFLIVLLISIRSDTRQKMAGISRDFKDKQAKLEQSVKRHQERVRERSKNLIAAIEKQLRLQRDLEYAIKEIAGDPARLEKQKEALEQEVAELNRKVAQLREEAGLTGESRTEALARLRAARNRRNQLKQKYIENYYAIFEAYQEAKDKNSAAEIRRFANSHMDTPFAPAALFDAGEKYRREGQADPALTMYRKITRGYSDSFYADKARERIAAIENRDSDWDQLSTAVVPLHPYKALDILN